MSENLNQMTVEDFIDFMQMKERCGDFGVSVSVPKLKIWNAAAAKVPPPPAPAPAPPMIQFSRADAILLRGLSGQKHKTKPVWTEKQRTAALMLIHKYRSQLKNKFDINVEDIITNPTWRNKEPRVLSTIKSITLNGDYFQIVSPFIPELVEELREARHQLKYSSVKVRWNYNDKFWMVEANPKALKFIDKIIREYGPFEITDEVNELVSTYNTVIDQPAPPTVRLENNQFVFRNMSNTQISIANNILATNDPIELKFWKLADCEFKLDDSLRSVLSWSYDEQNIILRSNVVVSAEDLSLIDLISFLDRIKVGTIFITYAWSGEIIKERVKELFNLFPGRVQAVDNYLGLQEKRPVNKYKTPNDADVRKIAGFVDSITDTSIIVAKDIVALRIENRHPVLVSISGLIGSSSEQNLAEAVGFSKVIKFQPSL